MKTTNDMMDFLDKPISEMTKKERSQFLALAQIGTIAVVDEVTKYQEVRGKKDLRKKFKEIKKQKKQKKG